MNKPPRRRSGRSNGGAIARATATDPLKAEINHPGKKKEYKPS